MNDRASRHYQTQQIMTASPAMLVFMLYDKAIVCLKEAIRAVEAGDIEVRCKANGRAMEIVAHLRGTLDRQKGGEIAANLDRLYGFILALLPKVDFNNDAGTAQTAIDLLTPMRESWRTLAARGDAPLKEAARIAAQMQPAPAAAPATSAPPPAQPPADRPRVAVSA
jgi:flagellar secretion chaperone FliS